MATMGGPSGWRVAKVPAGAYGIGTLKLYRSGATCKIFRGIDPHMPPLSLPGHKKARLPALPWGSEREGGPDPNLGQRDQFQVGIVPEVFVTVGKQHHPVGIQRGHRTLIVRDHDYGAREIGQRGQDLGA
ncbi:hypothetical protein ADIAG_02427 [Paeniglutamicibacter gangotriensis Lz1y]|uniref:Uncharacterized protein n=1 Tax=Paeniglutamicibacter gangotriensis Lz1y TaxID=1276920 RepID=M7MPW5_9MICC|nr:hypothetical protein ADIAG_02427 [Paeniglutamicibacter gangotriensis Lz1y]